MKSLESAWKFAQITQLDHSTMDDTGDQYPLHTILSQKFLVLSRLKRWAVVTNDLLWEAVSCKDVAHSIGCCFCSGGGVMVRKPHIRQPCSTESSSLRSKNGLSSGVVQKWTGQPFWVIARALAKTGCLAVWRAISKTDTGCLRNWTTGTWKILSSTLASFLYCRGSLDKASELATSADGLKSISYWYDDSRGQRWRRAAAKTGVAESGTKIFKGAVARYYTCTAMIDSGSWLTNRNRQKRRPATMRILRDFVIFAGTSRMFVSLPTASSLILKSIRQRLIEGIINKVNRSLCNYTRNQPNTFTAWLEICDRFNGLCWYASECNEQHFYAREYRLTRLRANSPTCKLAYEQTRLQLVSSRT